MYLLSSRHDECVTRAAHMHTAEQAQLFPWFPLLEYCLSQRDDDDDDDELYNGLVLTPT